MKPIKLKKGKDTIILFAVTDLYMGSEGGVYSYHVIDEKKKIASLIIDQIREYTFEGFIEDKETGIGKPLGGK